MSLLASTHRWMIRLSALSVALYMTACDDEEGGGGPGPTQIPDAAPPPPPMTNDAGNAPTGGQPMGGAPAGGSPMGGQPMGGDPMGGDPVGGQPMGGAPEGGGPMGGNGGAQSDCDPRLAAQACPPGQFCRPLPGGADYEGQCEPGDACTPGGDDCPNDRPYCHLIGGATICTAAGDLGGNASCVGDDRIPQPCADGFVCNFSVCTPVCDPAAPECPGNDRCDDISEAIGVSAGLCNAPACDFLRNEGCDVGERCTYAIRGDGRIVGSCRPEQGEVPDGEPCQRFPEGGDDCAPGLLCIGQGAQMVCRTLCDTGAYIDPCPPNKACVEALATGAGRVRGVGLCITNP